MSGTKVTSDPLSYKDPKVENPGIVTSDSLAGESVKAGGDFAATSSDRGVLDQKSSGTTANTTDTTNADTLEAAPSRAERSDGVSDQVKLGGSGVSRSAASSGEEFEPVESKPKGRDLQDGGEITGNEPNASWSTDISGKGDPGRVAVQKLAEDDAASRSANGGRQYAVNNENPYNELGGSTSA